MGTFSFALSLRFNSFSNFLLSTKTFLQLIVTQNIDILTIKLKIPHISWFPSLRVNYPCPSIPRLINAINIFLRNIFLLILNLRTMHTICVSKVTSFIKFQLFLQETAFIIITHYLVRFLIRFGHLSPGCAHGFDCVLNSLLVLGERFLNFVTVRHGVPYPRGFVLFWPNLSMLYFFGKFSFDLIFWSFRGRVRF